MVKTQEYEKLLFDLSTSADYLSRLRIEQVLSQVSSPCILIPVPLAGFLIRPFLVYQR